MKKDKQYWEERISTMPEAPDLPVKEDLKDTSIRQLNTYIEKERYLELQKLADDNNITLSGLYFSMLCRSISILVKFETIQH